MAAIPPFRSSCRPAPSKDTVHRLRKRSLAASVERRTAGRPDLSQHLHGPNLADSGPGSLRQAVLDANANPGADLISFAGGLHGTITLGSELSITDDLTIEGRGENRLDH